MNRTAVLLIGLLVVGLAVGSVGCGGSEVSPTPTSAVDATPTPEPITLKLISASPGTASEAYYLFIDLVEEYTEGRVLIDFYPGSQLFPGTEQWEALVTGSVDMLADSTYWFRDPAPDLLLFYIDGIWESYEHAYTVLEDSEVPRLLAEKLEEAAPVKLLGILPRSMTMCVLNTVRETSKFEDLRGLKCQGTPGYPSTPLYDYSGMASVPIAVEEASFAFVGGVVDAVNYPPSTMLDLGLDEPAKHALCYRSLFITTGIVIHDDAWQGLPPDIQDIILNEVMPEVYEFSKRAYREVDEAAVEEIRQNVETLHWLAEEDYAPYHEYMKTHAFYQVQMLMVDPEIVQMIDDLRPSKGLQ